MILEGFPNLKWFCVRLIVDAGLEFRQVSELYGTDWVWSFYERWSKKHLGNLIIPHLINKNCVHMHLYWRTEGGTGQEGCLLKETVLKNIHQVQLLEQFLSYWKLWCGFPGK